MHCRYGQFAFSGLFGIVFSRSDSRTQIMLCVVCVCVCTLSLLALGLNGVCNSKCGLHLHVDRRTHFALGSSKGWLLQLQDHQTAPSFWSSSLRSLHPCHTVRLPAPRARTHDQHRDTLPLIPRWLRSHLSELWLLGHPGSRVDGGDVLQAAAVCGGTL